MSRQRVLLIRGEQMAARRSYPSRGEGQHVLQFPRDTRRSPCRSSHQPRGAARTRRIARCTVRIGGSGRRTTGQRRRHLGRARSGRPDRPLSVRPGSQSTSAGFSRSGWTWPTRPLCMSSYARRRRPMRSMPSDQPAGKKARLAWLAILENAQLAIGSIGGMSFEEFSEDRRTFYAVTRCLEIISEPRDGWAEKSRPRSPISNGEISKRPETYSAMPIRRSWRAESGSRPRTA